MAICTCTVPTLACGLREADDQEQPGMVIAYAIACTVCRAAAQSTNGFEHALMLLRNGPVEAPEMKRVQ